RHVEVEAGDPTAHPAQLAVREAPDEVSEVEAAGAVGALFDLDLRIAALVAVGRRRAEARELEARFESEIFAEMKRVRAAREPRRRIEVARIPAAHPRE